MHTLGALWVHRPRLRLAPHLPLSVHTLPYARLRDSKAGAGQVPLTCGAGTEPVGRLQMLDAGGVLAGDVDGGGWRGWRVKPRLTGGISVRGEDLGDQSSPLSPSAWSERLWDGAMGGRDRPAPYLLGGREAGKGAQVGGVGDEHGLWKQACVRVLGHLGLVAVESWWGQRERQRIQTWPPGAPREASKQALGEVVTRPAEAWLQAGGLGPLPYWDLLSWN